MELSLEESKIVYAMTKAIAPEEMGDGIRGQFYYRANFTEFLEMLLRASIIRQENAGVQYSLF